MSVIHVCDWCGENIASGEPKATTSVAYSGYQEVTKNGYIGHYHSGERTCADEMFAALYLALEGASSIERIPVATGQKIGQLRRKHVKPGPQEGATS